MGYLVAPTQCISGYNHVSELFTHVSQHEVNDLTAAAGKIKFDKFEEGTSANDVEKAGTTRSRP